MTEDSSVPVRIVLRPYASSLPLASFAFATGNVLYSAFLLHWIPAHEAHMLAVMLLAFVAPLELVPSLFAFLARDSGGATAFAIFAGAWVVQGVELLHGPPQGSSPATGIFLICLALCLLLLMVVTFRGKPLLGLVLVVACTRTSLAAAMSLLGPGHFDKPAAWAGLLLALLAFYAAIAFLEEDTTQRLSPLTFRTGEARAALEGRLEDQISNIEKEAGVRKQL